MSVFENYSRGAADIEREIERKGIILGIDWTDAAQVRALAHEALTEAGRDAERAARDLHDHKALAKAELFGLAALMLKTMEQSALDGMYTHGGPVWKTFGRALWEEAENLRKSSGR